MEDKKYLSKRKKSDIVLIENKYIDKGHDMIKRFQRELMLGENEKTVYDITTF